MSRQSIHSLPIPDHIFITRSALQSMKDEACHHTDSTLGENETGGILIGRRLDTNRAAEVLIVAATGPGEDALHHTFVFGPDVDYCNEKLDEYHHTYPRMDYIGTWHKHPRSFPSFSRGDVATAHEIFHDPSYQIDEIINPIVWVDHNQQITIRYYYMDRAMAMRHDDFVEISAELVSLIDDDDDRVINEQSLYGRLIEENKQFLARGHPFELKTTDDEYIFTIPLAEIPGLIIYLIVQDGYPQHPPTIILEQDGQQLTLDEPKSITHWYVQPKRCYLVEVVDELTQVLTSLSPEERQQRIVAPIPAPAPAAPTQPDTPSVPDSPAEPSAPLPQQQQHPARESDESPAHRDDPVPTSPPAPATNTFTIGTYIPYLLVGGVVLILLVLVIANRSSASPDPIAYDNGGNADSAAVIAHTRTTSPTTLSVLASPTNESVTPLPMASPVPIEEPSIIDPMPLDQIVPPARVTLNGVPTGRTNTSYTFIADVEQPVTTMPITYTWAATMQSSAIRATQSLSDTILFAWSNPGTYVITVEVHNRVGLVTDTHEIVILEEE